MSVVGSGNHNESVKETGELGISVVQFPNFKNFLRQEESCIIWLLMSANSKKMVLYNINDGYV